MAFSYADLRTKSDDELIALHDETTKHVGVSVNYLLEELRRRDQMRAIKASHRLAAAALVLAGVNAVVAVVAVVIAVSATG